MIYVPSHVQIETVNRFCDARCPMCTIKFVPDFKKGAKDEFSNNGIARPAEIMSLETLRSINDEMCGVRRPKDQKVMQKCFHMDTFGTTLGAPKLYRLAPRGL